MDAWHITIAAQERVTLFRDEAERRLGATAMTRVSGPEALLFCAVDDHLHLVVAADRRRAGILAHLVGTALASRWKDRRREAARIRPVNGRAHLVSLVPYVLDQVGHHGLSGHPAVWGGSCFVDLVGARHLPGFRPLLRQALPRLTEAALWEAVRLSPRLPATDAEVASTGPAAVAWAAAAAIGRANLTGRTASVVAARTAAARMLEAVGTSPTQIEDVLAMPGRTRRHCRGRPVDRNLERAIRLQLAIRSAWLQQATAA